MTGEKGFTYTPAPPVYTQRGPGGSGPSPAGALAAPSAPAAPGQATPPSETSAISPGQSTLIDWTVMSNTFGEQRTTVLNDYSVYPSCFATTDRGLH